MIVAYLVRLTAPMGGIIHQGLFLQVVLSTHAIGGISQPDLIMAARIDALPVDYSPKWLQKQLDQQSSA